MSARCPICGETAPEPASLCIARVANTAERGKPCDYSQEGEARTADAIRDVQTELFDGRMQGRTASALARGGV